ncbi:MAG: hypothetical protein IJW50_07390 [Clostridia bacterium]|nr:hypothetical protein [Clostridia bacterium]
MEKVEVLNKKNNVEIPKCVAPIFLKRQLIIASIAKHKDIIKTTKPIICVINILAFYLLNLF